jgi:hypothetical protein
MRVRSILGILLILIGIIVSSILVFYPKNQTITKLIQLNTGEKANVTIQLPLRSWTSNWVTVILHYAPISSKNEAAVKQYSARLEMAGVEIEPKGVITTNVLSGEEAKFRWLIRSSMPGVQKGILWLFVEEGQNNKNLLYASEFDYTIWNLVGIHPSVLQVGAGLSLVIGIGLLLVKRKPINQ